MTPAQMQATRLNNLRKIIEKQGSVPVLAKRLRVSPIYIYNLLAERAPLRDLMARNIEVTMQLEPGALDCVEEKDDEIDIPLLSLNQRFSASIRTFQHVSGLQMDMARVKVTPQLREALIVGILDNLETMAQNRCVGLLPHHKAVLLKLAFQRLLKQGDAPASKLA